MCIDKICLSNREPRCMPLDLISMTCTVRVCVNIELDATKHKYQALYELHTEAAAR